MNKCQGEIVRVDIILSLLTIDRTASPQTAGKGYGQSWTICGDFTERLGVFYIRRAIGIRQSTTRVWACLPKTQAGAPSHIPKCFPFPRLVYAFSLEVRKKGQMLACGAVQLLCKQNRSDVGPLKVFESIISPKLIHLYDRQG